MVVLGLGGVLLKPESFLIIHCFDRKGEGAYFVQVPISVLDQNDQIRVFVTSRGHVWHSKSARGPRHCRERHLRKRSSGLVVQ